MHRSVRSRSSRLLIGSMVAFGLVTAACGSDDDTRQPSATEPGSATAPGASSASGDVVVFAAASLTDAFTELGDAFVATNPEVSVTFNFAASSALVAQVVEGAPADVLASADLENMAKLTDAGAAAGPPVVFTTNRAEIVVAPGNPLGITGVDDLLGDELVLVVCAPAAPCGSYASRIFDNAGVDPTPDSYEQNVRAVLTKVTLGEADVGVVYATDVRAAGDEADGVEIPADLNVVAEYPIAVTTESPNPDGAQAFIDFVLGDDGQAILASYGFASP